MCYTLCGFKNHVVVSASTARATHDFDHGIAILRTDGIAVPCSATAPYSQLVFGTLLCCVVNACCVKQLKSNLNLANGVVHRANKIKTKRFGSQQQVHSDMYSTILLLWCLAATVEKVCVYTLVLVL